MAVAEGQALGIWHCLSCRVTLERSLQFLVPQFPLLYTEGHRNNKTLL